MATIIFYGVIAPAAIAWAAFLAWDARAECRKIDESGALGDRALPAVGADHRAARIDLLLLSGALEVR
jgi:hypothetical protein